MKHYYCDLTNENVRNRRSSTGTKQLLSFVIVPVHDLRIMFCDIRVLAFVDPETYSFVLCLDT